MNLSREPASPRANSDRGWSQGGMRGLFAHLRIRTFNIRNIFGGIVPLKIIAPIQFMWMGGNIWSRNGATCVSSTSFEPKSAPKTKYWGKMVKGYHHEGRLPPPRGRCPLWWGVGTPRGGGSLKILHQISIFSHYLTPKKSNQKNSTETKRT